MVRVAGLEPAWECSREILSLLRLPIPPHPRDDLDCRTARPCIKPCGCGGLLVDGAGGRLSEDRVREGHSRVFSSCDRRHSAASVQTLLPTAGAIVTPCSWAVTADGAISATAALTGYRRSTPVGQTDFGQRKNRGNALLLCLRFSWPVRGLAPITQTWPQVVCPGRAPAC